MTGESETRSSSKNKRGINELSSSPFTVRKVQRKRKAKPPPEEPPTTIIQTDVHNSRLLVQELTCGPRRAKSPPSASPTTSLHSTHSASRSASPAPVSKKPPPAPKTNQRLRNLAPPPIRPAVLSGVGFRPFVGRKDAPQVHSEQADQPSNESASNVPASTVTTVADSFSREGGPMFASFPPFVFSPHWLSPLPVSPKDLFWATQIDSPGSLAMRELAMKAMAASSSGQEPVSQPSSIALPSPQLYPMLHGGFGIAFPFVGMAPHLTFNLGSVPAPPPSSGGGMGGGAGLKEN